MSIPPENCMSEPLPIRGLHHIARATRDAETCVAFYRDVLGFRELPRPPFNFRGAWLYNYGFQIHVIENPALLGEDGGIESRGEHLAFAVEDVEQVKATLTEQCIDFREQTNAGGTRQIFFQDPDGHNIEIAVYGDPAVGYQGNPS